MKFENTEKQGFRPFTITVETQEEANYLYALVAATNHDFDVQFSFSSNSLYDFLESKVEAENLRDVTVRLN